MFRFTEVSTRETWRSGSGVGFWFSGIPAHGSIVMVIEEVFARNGAQFNVQLEKKEWVELDWGDR